MRRCVDGLLARADVGSDRQLAAFRLAVRTGQDPDELGGWLDGRGLPPGLGSDPELAWAMVVRLAELTGDPSPIERQLQADPSAAGRVHAARARARLADAAAKEAAWRLIVGSSALGAYELYATAEGFFAASQHDLCRPYVDRYFTQMPQTAAFRSGWVLGQMALLAYPQPYTTPDVLAAAEACLDAADLAPAIRRSLVDGTDRLRRATGARRRYS